MRLTLNSSRLCSALLAALHLFHPASSQASARAPQATQSVPVPTHTTSPASPLANESDILRRARESYAKGDTAVATTLFLQILRHSPGDYEANETLGLIYAEAGDLAKALPNFQAAVKAQPDQAVAQANLGAALLRLDRSSEAADAFTRALRLNPKDAQAEANLARALLKTGQNEQAAEHFAKANTLAPPDPDLLYDWALALSAAAPARAIEVLSRIPPAEVNDQVESLYGESEEKQHHYPEAVAHLRRAAELTASEQNIYALTVELLRHWSWQPAEQVANYGRSRFPSSTRLTVALGIAQFGNERYPQAAATFSALLNAAPDNQLYGDLLGRTCDAIPDFQDSSCDRLQSFADAHPDNAQVDIYAASNILRSPQSRQDTSRANRLLEQAIRSDPQASEAFYQLGVLNQQQLHWAESIPPLQRAVALRPTYAAAHYQLSRAYFHLGDKQNGNEEIALQRRYQVQEKEDLDRKLKDVTRFIFNQP